MDVNQLAVVVPIVVAVLLWLVYTYAPIDAQVKQTMTVVVVMMVAIWLLATFGFVPVW